MNTCTWYLTVLSLSTQLIDSLCVCDHHNNTETHSIYCKYIHTIHVITTTTTSATKREKQPEPSFLQFINVS